MWLDALQQGAEEFVRLRRDIHQHPELGLAEQRTSAIVADRLRDWGYNVHTGLAGTGVVGQLRRGTGSKRLGLRADMDALPIQESNSFAHASCHSGVMHACGHDGHTAILLAAAKHIAVKVDFSGTLNLIFQPAEEHPGGAKIMIEQGLFDLFPCDAVFALHNMPGLPRWASGVPRRCRDGLKR
jgi:hippurate hydrolase